jgi:hypothetical protein
MKTALILAAIPVLALLASCPFALAHTGVTDGAVPLSASHRVATSSVKTRVPSPALPVGGLRREAPQARELKHRKIWRPVAEAPLATPAVPKLSIHPIIDVWLSPATITQTGEPTIRIIPARVGSAYGIAAVGAF